MANVQEPELVEIDRLSFAAAFAKRSVYVRHGLSDHPLFTLDAIAELADRLPPESVRRERGDLPFVNADGYVDVGAGPPSQTILDIDATASACRCATSTRHPSTPRSSTTASIR